MAPPPEEVDELMGDENSSNGDPALEEQIGGGPNQHRRRVPTPDQTTPTRLRPTIKTTPKATRVAHKAKDRRAQMVQAEATSQGNPLASLPEESVNASPPSPVNQVSGPPPQNLQRLPSPSLPVPVHGPPPQNMQRLSSPSLPVPVHGDPFVSRNSYSPATNVQQRLPSPSFPQVPVYGDPSSHASAANPYTILPPLPFHPPPPSVCPPVPLPLESNEWSYNPYLRVPASHQPAHPRPVSPPVSTSLRSLHGSPQPQSIPLEPLSAHPEPKIGPPEPLSAHPEPQIGPPEPPEARVTSLQPPGALPEHSDHLLPKPHISQVPITTVTPATPSPNKIGRFPNSEAIAIDKSIVRMEAALTTELNNLSVTREQYLRIWLKNDSRGLNYWNTYTEYFKQNLEQELARDPEGSSLTSTTNIPPSIRSACYAAFKSSVDNWEEVLDTYAELKMVSGSGETVASRMRRFEKLHDRLASILNMHEGNWGFQAAVVMCGNVVNQDGSMGKVFTTKDADNFFLDRCAYNSDEIIGQLKAHVFNSASTELVSEAKRRREASSQDGCNGEGESECPSEADSLQEAARVVAKGGSVDMENIKVRLVAMAASIGVKFNVKQFPWKTWPALLAAKGFITINYPENVLFPGDSSESAAKAKGISALTLNERKLLASALDSKEHPLQFQNAADKKAVLKSTAPAIIGVPPPPDSQETRGRRRFLDFRSDRNGPERLGASGASRKGKARAPVSDTLLTRPARKPHSATTRNEIHRSKKTVTRPQRVSTSNDDDSDGDGDDDPSDGSLVNDESISDDSNEDPRAATKPRPRKPGHSEKQAVIISSDEDEALEALRRRPKKRVVSVGSDEDSTGRSKVVSKAGRAEGTGNRPKPTRAYIGAQIKRSSHGEKRRRDVNAGGPEDLFLSDPESPVATKRQRSIPPVQAPVEKRPLSIPPASNDTPSVKAPIQLNTESLGTTKRLPSPSVVPAEPRELPTHQEGGGDPHAILRPDAHQPSQQAPMMLTNTSLHYKQALVTSTTDGDLIPPPSKSPLLPSHPPGSEAPAYGFPYSSPHYQLPPVGPVQHHLPLSHSSHLSGGGYGPGSMSMGGHLRPHSYDYSAGYPPYPLPPNPYSGYEGGAQQHYWPSDPRFREGTAPWNGQEAMGPSHGLPPFPYRYPGPAQPPAPPPPPGYAQSHVPAPPQGPSGSSLPPERTGAAPQQSVQGSPEAEP